MLQNKKEKLDNSIKGEAVYKLAQTSDWKLILECASDLIQDWESNLDAPLPASNRTIEVEPNYAVLLSARRGAIRGLREFFSLLENLRTIYLNKSKEDQVDEP